MRKLTILEQMGQIALEEGKTLLVLKEETALVDCGLDSLGFEVLVAAAVLSELQNCASALPDVAPGFDRHRLEDVLGPI